MPDIVGQKCPVRVRVLLWLPRQKCGMSKLDAQIHGRLTFTLMQSLLVSKHVGHDVKVVYDECQMAGVPSVALMAKRLTTVHR
jgi:hypothetical protein